MCWWSTTSIDRRLKVVLEDHDYRATLAGNGWRRWRRRTTTHRT
jgi:hypothetical protein